MKKNIELSIIPIGEKVFVIQGERFSEFSHVAIAVVTKINIELSSKLVEVEYIFNGTLQAASYLNTFDTLEGAEKANTDWGYRSTSTEYLKLMYHSSVRGSSDVGWHAPSKFFKARS